MGKFVLGDSSQQEDVLPHGFIDVDQCLLVSFRRGTLLRELMIAILAILEMMDGGTYTKLGRSSEQEMPVDSPSLLDTIGSYRYNHSE